MSSNLVLIDEPIPGVRRITLNRPEKRNALNHDMRGGILNGLEEADNDPSVRVMIVRGAGCCDLVYMSDDAEMGYPAVRFGVPDNHFHAWFLGMRKAMEMMITGDSLTAKECVELGWANASVPPDELEAKVLEVAKRVISVPADLVQLNKRVVHRQMEIMGLHTGIRAGAELCALGTHQKSMHEFMARTKEQGLKAALQDRDEPFGDYRTKEDQ